MAVAATVATADPAMELAEVWATSPMPPEAAAGAADTVESADVSGTKLDGITKI